jgi:hypothetical protein
LRNNDYANEKGDLLMDLTKQLLIRARKSVNGLLYAVGLALFIYLGAVGIARIDDNRLVEGLRNSGAITAETIPAGDREITFTDEELPKATITIYRDSSDMAFEYEYPAVEVTTPEVEVRETEIPTQPTEAANEASERAKNIVLTL